MLSLLAVTLPAPGQPFDAAPYGIPLTGATGVVWEDPREIHRVVVRFSQPPAAPDRVHIEYWSSRWPEQRLPKDRQPGGGDVGWWELGNWYRGEWRRADTDVQSDGASLSFTFRPLNARERPEVKDFPATWRYTLKIRVTSEDTLPPIEAIAAYTDSKWVARALRVVWKDAAADAAFEAFNGVVSSAERPDDRTATVNVLAAANPDPNTFDRTLMTIRWRDHVVTVDPAELRAGPIFVPQQGVAVTESDDRRDYSAVERDVRAHGGKTLYERVGEMPEQTWRKAWEGMPPKKSDIYVPVSLDGGRQKFRLDAEGAALWRTNDHFLRDRPGRDTPALDIEPAPVHISFGLPGRPTHRKLLESSLPMVTTEWDADGIRVKQEAFVTPLNGARADGPVPDADAAAVLMLRFTLTNPARYAKPASLSMRYESGGQARELTPADDGLVLATEARGFRGAYRADGATAEQDGHAVRWRWSLHPGESRTLLLKLPYELIGEKDAANHLDALGFDREWKEIAGYWRRRLNESAALITPEPMLNEFYRAHAGHLLINCEREPGSDRRFARVGSFGYGAYGNESCMMVVDLDRRGYHREAQQCLDAWLKYQSTVGLPGDFSSHEGVLYGAGGYESGGYNQHHGWILWCMAEHYRFTRDADWLRRAAPGILAGADWIIRERARTADRTDLARGLLPAGSLEDIADWWPWLSTNCYTWRGLDSAAWALEQIQHPDAPRLRKEADAYHAALLAAFRAAADRSPVVRLRDGTSVPHVPSQVYRHGRSFGWITETLEGALHLLITRALGPRSPEATAILNDYEDNLYLSNQYGYTLDDFDRDWFGRGGMSMQACLLLDVEPYLYRDDVKQALRATFNAIAVGYFPDAHMLTEHALPEMGDWRGDHYKSSDEANAAGWLRYLFLREEGDTLLVGQAIPREWLGEGKRCGIERASTYFGDASIVYTGGNNQITAELHGPKRNPPRQIHLRFRAPNGHPPSKVTVNGKPGTELDGDWVLLPGAIGHATVTASW